MALNRIAPVGELSINSIRFRNQDNNLKIRGNVILNLKNKEGTKFALNLIIEQLCVGTGLIIPRILLMPFGFATRVANS